VKIRQNKVLKPLGPDINCYGKKLINFSSISYNDLHEVVNWLIPQNSSDENGLKVASFGTTTFGRKQSGRQTFDRHSIQRCFRSPVDLSAK
jgi:hypothetical protein